MPEQRYSRTDVGATATPNRRILQIQVQLRALHLRFITPPAAYMLGNFYDGPWFGSRSVGFYQLDALRTAPKRPVKRFWGGWRRLYD